MSRGFSSPSPELRGSTFPAPPFPLHPPSARCLRASLAAAQLQGPRLANPKRRDPSPLSPHPQLHTHQSPPRVPRSDPAPRLPPLSPPSRCRTPSPIPPARNPTLSRFSNTPSRLPRRLSPPFPTPALLDAARRPHPSPPLQPRVVASRAPFVTHVELGFRGFTVETNLSFYSPCPQTDSPSLYRFPHIPAVSP